VPSPIDDWIFYGVVIDEGGFDTLTETWGQDPGLEVGRRFIDAANIHGLRLFAPGVGRATSVF
jgi:hypothetical protein